MKLREDIDVLVVDDLYYDVFNGGHLHPDKVLADQDDIDRVSDAIDVLEEYFSFLEENSEEM